MCRHLGYLGRPRSLDALLRAPAHSLEVQSYAPKEMETALLNADGFGVAWYVEGHAEPARYRSPLPRWADETLPELAPRLATRCLIANARSATPGLGMGIANTPPFTHGPWTFSHNGFVASFRDGPMRALRRDLSDAAYGAIRGAGTDSEHLFAVFLDALAGGSDPLDALRAVVAKVDAIAPARKALLSLVATDGAAIYALRHALRGDAPTLYLHRAEGDAWLASEPPFEAPWEPIAPGTLLRLDAGGAHREPLA